MRVLDGGGGGQGQQVCGGHRKCASRQRFTTASHREGNGQSHHSPDTKRNHLHGEAASPGVPARDSEARLIWLRPACVTWTRTGRLCAPISSSEGADKNSTDLRASSGLIKRVTFYLCQRLEKRILSCRLVWFSAKF